MGLIPSLLFKIEHQKCMYFKEIELLAQNMMIIMDSTMNTLEEGKGRGYTRPILMSTRIPNFDEHSPQDIHTSSKNYDESSCDFDLGILLSISY